MDVDYASGTATGRKRRAALAACCGLTLLIGTACLAGYVFGVPRLVTFLPGLPVTTVTTAISISVLAVALALAGFGTGGRARLLACCLSGAVAVAESGVLAEYLIGRDLGIDRLLFAGHLRDWAGGAHPGRQSPHSAVLLLSIGLAILLIDVGYRQHLAFKIFAPLTVIAALSTALGQIYGVSYLYGTTSVSGISAQSVLAFVLLAGGYLLSRPGRRPVSLLFAGSAGSMMIRRLLPFAVAVLLVMAASLGVIGRLNGALRGLDIVLATGTLLAVMYLVLIRTALLIENIGLAQQRLNDELTHERDLNHAMLDALLDGMIAAESDGRVAAVNDRFCEMLGAPEDEIIGQRPPYWWSAEESRAQPFFLFTEELATGRRLPTEIQIVRRDGSRMPAARSVAASFTPGRRAALFVVSYRDLTERNEERAERRTLAERLGHFFDMSSDLLCVAGQDGYFKLLNPAWERVFGYPVDELLARPFLDFIHPDDRSVTSAENHVLGQGIRGTGSFENRYRRADGAYRWLSWTATSSVEDGLIYAVARDVTNERLDREARTQLAAIVESTDDAVIGMTLDGIITSWNAAAERIYGTTAEEAIGQSVAITYPDDQAEDVEHCMVRVRAGEPIKDHQRIGIRKDGVRVHLSVTVSPLRDPDGTVIGASAIARNITDRILEQEMLEVARDQALAADRAKSQFVAMVSHEIRTPLNGIIGLNTLMLESGLSPRRRRFADGVDTSARALLSIVNDILDFSKVEAGKMALVPTDFDLHLVIANAVRVAAENARGKHLELIGCYPPDLPRTRHGDADRLGQVLINLLGNAVKFTSEGEVRLDVAPAGGDNRCRFAVTDTGIGIEPDILDRLFEPFAQAEQDTCRRYGGTGLGLTISRDLVDLMGGQLEASSRPGVGSTFSFTIGLPLAGRRAARQKHPVKNHLMGRRLLIADGNATSRRLLADHARYWGMIVTPAADVESALGAGPASTTFDVIAVDSGLCGNPGGALAGLLNPGTAAARGPRIVLLSRELTHAEQHVQGSGVADVLQKPVDPSALYNCLIDLLGMKPESAAEKDLPESNGNVLVAEDNTINQMVAEEFLTALGYHVDIAHDGRQAVEMAAAGQYRAILMDCQMPVMDGYQATREVRAAERHGRHLPIIAMTAGAMAADRQRCLDAGMDDCLTKPVDPAQLKEILLRWIAVPADA
ncbi:PAS domain S-box protein [Actinoplanes sp. NPDC051513]|uniref:PAS domain S-box protein n=1 Tax=Actinoplanes sp. NPDC051513 TaxID=3363908 RepID=UPI0037AE7B03